MKKLPFTLKLWGTRGSLPAPRPTTNKFGGNTPCVEIRVEDEIIILDAGSGIRELGLALGRQYPKMKASVFFSHYHWDHIHGFPFFGPAYVPDNQFTIYGETRDSRGIKDILSGQMAMPYFPVPIEVMRARFDFKEVGPGSKIQLGPACIKAEAINHPGRALSYRIEYQDKAIVYATDTEHGSSLDKKLVRHCEGADILIYDATYTDEEIRTGKRGYGHSSWNEGVRIAQAAGVKKLLLFHHEPSRNDHALASIEKAARSQFRRASMAREKKYTIP